MRRARATRRGQHGFTLIEVIVSLGIMTIGAMTMLALQQHTIRSNSHARQLTTAMQIAQLWIERLKQDAHAWNQPTATVGDAEAALANTVYLQSIITDAGRFVSFTDHPDIPDKGSRVYDFRGTPIRQITNGAIDAVFYCASYRPAWVYVGRAMRVDVRVWWPREGSGRHPGLDFDDWCTDDNVRLDPGGEFFDDYSYHVVYLSTVIRVQPVTR